MCGIGVELLVLSIFTVVMIHVAMIKNMMKKPSIYRIKTFGTYSNIKPPRHRLGVLALRCIEFEYSFDFTLIASVTPKAYNVLT
jgi:hypothetical protein